MTVKKIAENWGVSECTVRKYCKKGWILGAVKTGGRWDIPENYPKPYISKKRKFRSASEKSNYVMQAIGSGEFLDFRLLALSREEFDSYAWKLQEEGLVESGCEGYEATQKGLDRCDALQQRSRQTRKDAVCVAISAAGPVISAVGTVINLIPQLG